MDIYLKIVITEITARTVIICLILAVMIAVAAGRLCKRGRLTVIEAVVLPLFVSYLYFVLAITIFDRIPGKSFKYELELFWSYKAALAGTSWLLMENFLNIVLFVPAGICLSILMKKRLLVVTLMAALFSVAIEISQLVMKCGLFEFDDIFHNTLGSVAGSMIANVIERGIAYAADNVRCKCAHRPSISSIEDKSRGHQRDTAP